MLPLIEVKFFANNLQFLEYEPLPVIFPASGRLSFCSTSRADSEMPSIENYLFVIFNFSIFIKERMKQEHDAEVQFEILRRPAPSNQNAALAQHLRHNACWRNQKPCHNWPTFFRCFY